MKFELDDDTVLRLSGVATAAYSATLLVVPRTSHDIFYVAQVSNGKGKGQWGVVLYVCPAPPTTSSSWRRQVV